MNNTPVEILIVEDSPTQALQLQFILEAQGYQTSQRASGEEALIYLSNHQPALVISAVVLPGIDGYQLCKRIKINERLRHIPVILLSSLSKSQDMIKGVAAGADHFVVKSADWPALMDYISELLTEPQLQTETDLFLIAPEAIPIVTAQANRAATEFLANMSHELRTPLNAILGFAQVMARSSTFPAEHQQNLNIIMRSGEHLLTLINNILELSKIETGRTVEHEENFDLHQLLYDLADRFRVKAEEKGLYLRLDYPPDLPRHICADKTKLCQVLNNLLDNAVKFTEQGGVTLRVGSREYGVSSKGTKLEVGNKEYGVRSETEAFPRPYSLLSTAYSLLLHFEIEDSGPGIAPDKQETIFEAFRQTQMGKKTGEGTGLGLPLSHQIVRLMGGELSLDSEPGRGATLRFYIQATLLETEKVESTQPVHQVMGLAPNQPVYRILIADDSSTNRFLLTQLLEPLGFELRETVNGQEAVEIWEQWSPHLICMDMRMPLMDGYEATRRIKSTTQGQVTVIVALTASAMEEERAAVLAAGCDDFLRKPFRDTELFEMLSKHLGIRYIYEDEETETVPSIGGEPGGIDIPAALASLPPDLLATLEQATIRLDLALIGQIIDQIRSYQPVLANILDRLTHDFNFDEILAALQKAQTQL